MMMDCWMGKLDFDIFSNNDIIDLSKNIIWIICMNIIYEVKNLRKIGG